MGFGQVPPSGDSLDTPDFDSAVDAGFDEPESETKSEPEPTPPADEPAEDEPEALSPAPEATPGAQKADESAVDWEARIKALETEREELARKNEEYQEALLAAQKPAEEKAPELPENLRQLDSMLAERQKEYNEVLEAWKAHRSGPMAKNVEKIEALQGQLSEVQDEIDNPGPNSDQANLAWQANKITRKLREAQAEKQSLRQQDDAFNRAHKAAHEGYWTLKPVRDEAERNSQLRQQFEERQRSEASYKEAEARKVRRSEFDTAAKTVANDPTLGWSEAKKQRFLGDGNGKEGWAIKEARSFLRDNPQAYITDWNAFMRHITKEFDELAMLGTKDYAKEKLADAQQPGSKRAASKPSPRRATMEDFDDITDASWAKEA